MRGYFSTKNIKRKYPLLATFHRGIDGGLIGVLLCTATVSALALHSQYLWTLSYSRLEVTRNLTHRLEESIANFERYLLKSITLPKTMVETKSSDLLYLDYPPKTNRFNLNVSSHFSFGNKFLNYPITHGY